MADYFNFPEFAKYQFARVVLFILILSRAGWAQAEDLQFSDQLFQISPVSDLELDENRGGFVTRNGVRVDFSFDKSTFVNGIKQAQTVLNFGGNNIELQPGNNSALSASQLPTSINVVNSFLPNQVIQDITTINIRFSNVGLVQRSALHSLNFSTFPGGIR